MLLKKLESIGKMIGGTPMKKLNFTEVDVYAKLEYNNYTGSIKDRAAYNVLYEGIMNGKINQNTTIVESSSGNFAIALSTMCNELGLKFIPVIDPNINPPYEQYLNLMAHHVDKVTEVDETGGYLLTRIKRVEHLCAQNKNTYWTNQYENPHNYQAYYKGLGEEICQAFDHLDYLFVSVSSGGTVTGLSLKLKEKFKDLKVVAVDVEGSVIFNKTAKKRSISGLGASKRPITLDKANIDEVVVLPESEIIDGTIDLLREQQIFAGASSGANYQAVRRFMSTTGIKNQQILFLCHDKGFGYLDTVYNKEWSNKIKKQELEII